MNVGLIFDEIIVISFLVLDTTCLWRFLSPHNQCKSLSSLFDEQQRVYVSVFIVLVSLSIQSSEQFHLRKLAHGYK